MGLSIQRIHNIRYGPEGGEELYVLLASVKLISTRLTLRIPNRSCSPNTLRLSTLMPQRLDFSFLASCDSRVPKPPAESCSTQTESVPTSESYDVDTPVIRIPAKERYIPRERTLADLAHLRIGLHTVPDFVKELEKVVGCELKSTLHQVGMLIPGDLKSTL